MKHALQVFRDDRGIAAIEFGLIVPVLVVMLLFGAEGWLRIDAASKMRSSLQAGARYYQSGGTDDVAAASLAMQGWATKPADAAVNAARSCQCGGGAADCASLCTNNIPPKAFVNLTATGTFTGFMHTEVLSQTSAVRIR
jgi:Flp pilus assembly protein TadG